MGDKKKNGIIVFIFAVLLLPFSEQNLSFIKSRGLDGYYAGAPDVAFSCAKWFDGSYRDEKSRYLADNTGFRADMVRLNNQVEYSLFHILHGNWGVTDSDHCLMQPLYIRPYYGKDFEGYAVIHEKLRKLKAVQDTLSQMGKSLILVHAACKAFFYPEYIPAFYRSSKRGTTNFETYVRIADSMKINQLDFNSWFAGMKNKSKDLIYTKQGLHWSIYGSLLAADSLISYIEQLRNIQMPHPIWNKIVHTTQAKYSDDDIARALNLIYPFTTETYTYPIVTYPTDNNMVKPSVIYIGDSFLFQWMENGLMDSTNTGWQIWYYFTSVMDKNNRDIESKNLIANYDWINAMNHADCIVLLYTSHNLPELGDGFIEKAYDHFYPVTTHLLSSLRAGNIR